MIIKYDKRIKNDFDQEDQEEISIEKNYNVIGNAQYILFTCSK